MGKQKYQQKHLKPKRKDFYNIMDILSDIRNKLATIKLKWNFAMQDVGLSRPSGVKYRLVLEDRIYNYVKTV